MIDTLKNIIKNILSTIGIFLSHNQRYDWQLKKIIQQLTPAKNDIALVDIGAHKGEVTNIAKRYHKSRFLLFEPIPILFNTISKQYAANPEVEIFNLALASQKGSSSFQYNHSHPAYSGILKREYPSEHDRVEEITIQTDTLDNVVRALENVGGIALIKIDVEGAELGVLQGATETIKKFKPLIVFEHGLGASDFYNTSPDDIFSYFQALDMNIQTMENWHKKNQQTFSLADFKKQFYNKLNYYFIAYPNV